MEFALGLRLGFQIIRRVMFMDRFCFNFIIRVSINVRFRILDRIKLMFGVSIKNNIRGKFSVKGKDRSRFRFCFRVGNKVSTSFLCRIRLI